MLALELKHQFDTLADALELLGEGTFRVRAYRRVAQLMTETPEHDLHAYSEKELEDIPGVGESMAKKIIEYREKGEMHALTQAKRKIPPGLFDLLKIPTLGPKSIRKMWKELGVEDMSGLEQVIDDGSLAKLYGFGEKKVENIRNALHLTKKSESRIPLKRAKKIAAKMKAELKNCPEVEQIEIAGSLRREKEDIGDIDFLVKSRHPKQVIECFTALPTVVDIIAQGATKASVRIDDEGRQVDLRVVSPESFGSALQYFTGSKQHNIQLRKIAQQKGLKLSEYGIYRGSDKIAGATEESVYKALGQKMPPPPKRLGQDELTEKS